MRNYGAPICSARRQRQPSSPTSIGFGVFVVLLAGTLVQTVLYASKLHRMEDLDGFGGERGLSSSLHYRVGGAAVGREARGVVPPAENTAEATDPSSSQSRRDRLVAPSPSGEDVHVVFSTDCSGYQHWQSIVFWYSALRAGHAGPITRIASGCSAEQERKIREEYRRMDADGRRLGVHFTPSFALKGKHYKYSNKPGGLKHWLDHVRIDEAAVCLVDPDMMLLHPITSNLGEGLTPRIATAAGAGGRLTEYSDERHGDVRVLRESHLPPLPPSVRPGHAAGQHFGIGGAWASAGTPRARKDFADFDKSKVCGDVSPCANATRSEVDAVYAVGPVYLSSTADWPSLASKWYEYVPRVHEMYPKLLAEMYALTMAAADRELEFSLVSSYMVSDPKTMSTTEAWTWVDDYGNDPPAGGGDGAGDGKFTSAAEAVCFGAGPTTLPAETLRRSGAVAGRWSRLPATLHYCQRYSFAGHVFAKRKVPHDFFRCDGSPMSFDAETLMAELRQPSTGVADRRTAFMLCHLIPMMNLALKEYKSHACGGGTG